MCVMKTPAGDKNQYKLTDFIPRRSGRGNFYKERQKLALGGVASTYSYYNNSIDVLISTYALSWLFR